MPHIPQMGTNPVNGVKADRVARGWIGDPLGTKDPLPVMKSPPTISRTELMHLKKKVKSLLSRLEKLTKASPILDEHSKKGGQASEERSSAPTGMTEVRVEDSAGYFFDDTSLNGHIVGKR